MRKNSFKPVFSKSSKTNFTYILWVAWFSWIVANTWRLFSFVWRVIESLVKVLLCLLYIFLIVLDLWVILVFSRTQMIFLISMSIYSGLVKSSCNFYISIASTASGFIWIEKSFNVITKMIIFIHLAAC